MALTKKQKAIVQRWVKALRSGKYEQGRNYLRKKSGGVERFCCLGVLCELAVKEKVISAAHYDGNKTYSYSDTNQVLPDVVQEWVGLRTDTGDYGDISLVELNDNGSKFTTIAKTIESAPEGLFI